MEYTHVFNFSIIRRKSISFDKWHNIALMMQAKANEVNDIDGLFAVLRLYHHVKENVYQKIADANTSLEKDKRLCFIVNRMMVYSKDVAQTLVRKAQSMNVQVSKDTVLNVATFVFVEPSTGIQIDIDCLCNNEIARMNVSDNENRFPILACDIWNETEYEKLRNTIEYAQNALDEYYKNNRERLTKRLNKTILEVFDTDRKCKRYFDTDRKGLEARIKHFGETILGKEHEDFTLFLYDEKEYINLLGANKNQSFKAEWLIQHHRKKPFELRKHRENFINRALKGKMFSYHSSFLWHELRLKATFRKMYENALARCEYDKILGMEK